LTQQTKYAPSRGIFYGFILAILIITTGLQGSAPAGERFTHDPFVPAHPIIPVSQLKPGMRGECYTVVRGSEVVSFSAEIIDIISNRGNPKNLILVRASGRVVESTGGIASGMSGSPFYIDGKLAGAIGYGWHFTDQFHCLVTPIEDMLEIWNNPEIIPSFEPAPMIAEVPPPVSPDPLPDDDEELDEEITDGAEPDDSPEDYEASWDRLLLRYNLESDEQSDSFQGLFISGVSNRMASRITEALGVDAAPFGGASDGSSKSVNYNPTLKPGMAIGASLLWGDVEIGALGTLTALSDDGRFIAFGHPLIRLGPTAMALTEARVSAVIPGMQTSFKIGTTGDIIGIITQDRPQGIGGRIGQFAPAASFGINLTDVDSGRSYKRAFQMVQDKYLLSSLSSLAVVGSIENLWGRSGGGSAKVTATYSGSALRDGWTRTNIFVSETDVTRQMLSEFSELTQMFAVNPFQELRPFGVNIDVEITQEPRVLYVEDVKVHQDASLRPGDTVSFDVTLRPWRRDPFVRTYSLKVPDNISGIAQLLVRGGGIAEETAEYHDLAWRSITSLPILLRELDAKETNDQIIMEIRGQESWSAQIARARNATPGDMMNDKLASDIRDEKMEEGSMRVIRTNYYVDGIIHRLIMIGDGNQDYDTIRYDEWDDFGEGIENECAGDTGGAFSNDM